jgi:hypothetical protein
MESGGVDCRLQSTCNLQQRVFSTALHEIEDAAKARAPSRQESQVALLGDKYRSELQVQSPTFGMLLSR